MTDIERKALALMNAEIDRDPTANNSPAYEALCRAIEQHETDIADLQAEYDEVCRLFEAFRQEVSDAVEAVFAGYHDAPIPWVVMRRKLEPFIIAKPDPLVEVLADMGLKPKGGYDWASEFRNTLAQRGGKIVWE